MEPMHSLAGRGASALARLVAQARHGLRERRSGPFVEAYVAAIARRVPVLYAVIVFDVALLVLCFRGTAPTGVLMAGVALALVAGLRGRYWLPGRIAALSLDRKRVALAAMPRVGGLFALGFMIWSLVLVNYANAAQVMLVHYLLAVTAFAAIVALAQAPRTASRVALAFSMPALAFFLTSRDPDAIALALAQIVLTATMLIAIVTGHSEFVRRETTARKLARRLARTARESRDNLHKATIDDLTGGLNRRAILQRLHNELTARGNRRRRAWLALADLDGFKHVNDTYGHAAGDAVLRTVAWRIGAQDGITAHGRLGGDEFALLIDADYDAEAALATCRALTRAVRQPIAFNGTELKVLCSVGLYRIDQTETSACLERADAALYLAKQQGDGAVVLFGHEDEAALHQRALITRQFHDSVLEDRLRLVYQPVIDVRDGRRHALEALARWSPDGVTWQPPAMFMAMALATGRIGEVTRVVLTRALAECAPRRNGVALSINLSPRDVVRAGLAETLSAITAECGGRTSDLIVEVTERALLDDPRRALRQLEALRTAGFRIALDDFGAGWSSLSQLRELPLDQVKLHGALAEALPTDPGARAVAGTIVALSWQLGIDCTIKGIETAAQAEAARALGITLMQGYYFGAPGSAEAALSGAVRAVA